MSDRASLLVPGARPAGTEVVTAPYDGSPLATIETAGADAVELALTIARDLFQQRDQWLPRPRRIEILERTASLMADRSEELALAAAQEGGKPLLDSRVEVARAIDGLRICVETLRSEGGREIPMNVNAASAGRIAMTRRYPIGPVVAVSAFNHPLNLIVHQVAPAVAVGCPVIVKPANNTPLSCFRFVDLLRQAGLPEGWCQAFVTDTLADATRLATDARVAFFSFIGSARVGWMLRSQLAPGTRCALEHGGAAPVIVAADADVAELLPLLAKGGFYHAGQVCVSVQRVFVHHSLATRVAEGLARQARAMRVGDPVLDSTEVGPLITTAEADRIEQWVAEAARDARILAGGERLTDSTYAPTVLLDPPVETRVSRLEIFGPVICVYSFTDIDDAIARANSLPHAFQAAVFSKDLDTLLRVYERIDASAVMFNDHTAFRVDWMPFAGLRESGLGVGGIPYTMHDMQYEKMMVLRSPQLG